MEILIAAFPDIIGGLAVAIILGTIGYVSAKLFRKNSKEDERSEVQLVLESKVSEVIENPDSKNQSSAKSRGEYNHLLISPDTPFNRALWQELLDNKEGLRISKVYEFSDNNKFGQYKKYVDDFLRDAKAKWLFTIWPEDSLSIWEEKEYRVIIDKLRRDGKYIICFESGMTWDKYQKGDLDVKPIFIVRTEYTNAVKVLISHIAKNILRNASNIHIVAILGPVNSPAAIERRKIYNEFLARLYHSRGLYLNPYTNFSDMVKSDPYWQGLMEGLVKLEHIRTTYLEISDWYRSEAEEIVTSISLSLEESRVFSSTCFVCGNDDIALGARDAVRKCLGQTNKNTEFSYIGFDGIDEMIRELQAGMAGATMRIHFEEMCRSAQEIVKDPDSFMEVFPTPLEAEKICF